MTAPFSIPSPDSAWQVWEINVFGWQLNIHTYALCILLGIVLAIIITSRRLTKRGAEPGVVLDIALWAVPLGIIGARIYHVLTHPTDYFAGQELWRVFAIWEGGNAIFGSLIGGAIGVLIGCRITGLRFWSFADALAPGLLVAQAVGRLGNWFNHELFGAPTDLPWGLEIESDNPAWPAGLEPGTLFHPTFLYELLWNVAGALLLVFVLERRFALRWGKAFGFYLIWYGIGRSFFEAIRVDPSEMFLGIRTNVWAAWAAVVLGIVLILVQRRRHPGLEPSVYVPGREWAGSDAEVDSDETESDSDSPDDGVEGENAEDAAAATSTDRPTSA
ncbi:prolipoprotein diacylglyceryl transferase [Agromyces sp. MMS24-JH15]|uniref:prolipoprotein diacylglyceryl transferase n=1 Tax=Agromyces sp. MMS24-JH15 TaxID=3243765 RepID=UPI003747FA71